MAHFVLKMCTVIYTRAVLSQGKPRDAFRDHCKADEGLHINYNNTGLILKVSEEIATNTILM